MKIVLVRNRNVKETLKDYFSVIGLLGIIIFFAIITEGKTLQWANVKRILLQSCLYIIGGLGVTFTISQGNLDMSLGGIICMAGVCGLMAAELHAALLFPIIMLIAVISQTFIGLLHNSLNIPTVIVSFAVCFFGQGMAGYLYSTTDVVLSLPNQFSFLNTKLFFYMLTGVLFIIAFVIFHYTKIGKYNRAIGSNILAAYASGVPVNRYRILAWMFSGLMMGFVTSLFVIRAGGISATSGFGFEISVLILLVIGGVSLSGGTKVKAISALVGAVMLLVLENGLTVVGLGPDVIGLVKGVVFLGAVAISFDRNSVQNVL